MFILLTPSITAPTDDLVGYAISKKNEEMPSINILLPNTVLHTRPLSLIVHLRRAASTICCLSTDVEIKSNTRQRQGSVLNNNNTTSALGHARTHACTCIARYACMGKNAYTRARTHALAHARRTAKGLTSFMLEMNQYSVNTVIL